MVLQHSGHAQQGLLGIELSRGWCVDTGRAATVHHIEDFQTMLPLLWSLGTDLSGSAKVNLPVDPRFGSLYWLRVMPDGVKNVLPFAQHAPDGRA
jgi:hypothetical protein